MMKCQSFYRSLKKLFLSLSLVYLFSLSNAQALETDQYMMWGKELNDVTAYLNGFINKRTWKAIDEVNHLPKEQRNQLSCEAVHQYIFKSYNENKGLDFISEIERLIYDDPTLSRYPPKETGKIATINQSIYKKSKLFKLKMFGININVNGIYTGLDKTDHVFRTGYGYFKTYKKHRRKGKTEEQAIIAAIKKGIIQEKTYFGFWVSGVFSYADLEANYQGLRFHRDFCEGKKPYLFRRSGGTWGYSRSIDLKDYVNPWFDESYNTSAYLALRFKSVYPELKKHCDDLDDPWLQEQRDYYKKWLGKESFSVRYLKKLLENGKLPSPKKNSLRAICSHW